MHKIKFKKLVMQNFLCFGNEPVVIDFENLGDCVLIRGKNLDVQTEETNSSNGSGKSSLLDGFIYGLFGKTVKNPKKITAKDVINNISAKKLVVEIYFDDYKIQRCRKPDSLKIWKSSDNKFDDSTELTRGETKQTQAFIENILGFNYETMKSICVFTDSNSDSYLESSAQERRMIIENLLGLEKYRKFHEKTKELLKENKTQAQTFATEADKFAAMKSVSEQNLKAYKDKKSDWSHVINESIKKLNSEIVICENAVNELAKSDPQVKIYEDAQINLKSHEDELELVQTKMDKQQNVSEQISEKLKEINNSMQSKQDEMNPFVVDFSVVKKEIDKAKSALEKLNDLCNHAECENCFGKISSENLVKIRETKDKEILSLCEKQKDNVEKLKLLKEELQTFQDQKKLIDIARDKVNEAINSSKSTKVNLQNKINDLKKIQKPETSLTIDKYKNKINLLKSTIIEKEHEIKNKSPFCDLITSTEESINKYKESLKELNNNIIAKNTEMNMYEFWLEAFSEKGIRKFIIDQILPILNKTISDMLQVLIEGKLSLVFDNEFNEMITKFPENSAFPYDLLSNGQKRRINLALSQAFAYVRQLNVGNYPDVIFLDEISINMDSQGNQAIFMLIKMLSKDKKVFVTTHDQELQQLLSDKESITFQMKNGMSKIM